MQLYHDSRNNRYEDRYFDEEVPSYEQEYGYPARRRNSRRDGIIGGTGLMGAATLLMIADMSLHGILISGLLIAAGIVVMLPKETNTVLSKLDKWQKKDCPNQCRYLTPSMVHNVLVAVKFAHLPLLSQQWWGNCACQCQILISLTSFKSMIFLICEKNPLS